MNRYRVLCVYQSWSACNQENSLWHETVAETGEQAEEQTKTWFGAHVYGSLLYVQAKEASVYETP